MAKSIKILLTLFLLLFIISLGVGLYFYITLNEAPENFNEDYTYLVSKGMTVSSIGYDLIERGSIQSYKLFRIYHQVTGPNNTIPTGNYTIYGGMKTSEIYKKLVSGKQDMISLTIPEGLTASQIGARYERAGICSKLDFLKVVKDQTLLDSYGFIAPSLEGYLFPDTYRFVIDQSPEKVVTTMVDSFIDNLDRIYPDWRDLTPEQIRDKVVMASIVEKEYRLAEEAPLISSVFYNRLDHPDFPLLQSCATVVYVITEINNRAHPERLYYKDLAIESPFNTYSSPGLPPGAISNPGYTALNASFHPAETNYIFFVVKDARVGSHNFSASYSDFLDDKDSYLDSYRSK